MANIILPMKYSLHTDSFELQQDRVLGRMYGTYNLRGPYFYAPKKFGDPGGVGWNARRSFLSGLGDYDQWAASIGMENCGAQTTVAGQYACSQANTTKMNNYYDSPEYAANHGGYTATQIANDQNLAQSLTAAGWTAQQITAAYSGATPTQVAAALQLAPPPPPKVDATGPPVTKTPPPAAPPPGGGGGGGTGGGSGSGTGSGLSDFFKKTFMIGSVEIPVWAAIGAGALFFMHEKGGRR